MTNFFWAGGPTAYALGLKEHYEVRMRDLRVQLDRCDNPSESDAIERELDKMRNELIEKLREINQLIF